MRPLVHSAQLTSIVSVSWWVGERYFLVVFFFFLNQARYAVIDISLVFDESFFFFKRVNTRITSLA